MQYVLILPDGAADHPCEELGGRTPLQAARTPALDRLAAEGCVGSVLNVPDHMQPGSDVATLSLLGFDPARYHTGRAPLEAPSLGVDLKADQTAFRVNFVTVEDGRMIDHAAGHISSEEAHALLETVRSELETDRLRFYPGVQYRSLMIVEGTAWADVQCTPPHDIPGQSMDAHRPAGPGSDQLNELIDASVPILAAHPVNRRRAAAGRRAATHLWPWGQGTRPALPTFQETFGVSGAMIAAVDLLRSIGIYLGLELLPVDGMTGYLDTNFAGKGEAAVAAMDKYDLVICHIEAPDEAGHKRDPRAKTEAIEQVDRHIVGPVLAEAKRRGEVRICALPDHPTPCDVGIHTRERVPLVLWGPGVAADGASHFDEQTGLASPLRLAAGPELMPLLLK